MNLSLNKIPEITLYFWVIKILSTTVGETGADFLSGTLGLGLSTTSYIMGGILLILLSIQLKLKRYIPVSYWSVVVMMSIVGTLITDKLVDDLGVSLVALSIFFTIAMVVVFTIWYMKEKTLSIHSIHNFIRETYYWIVILITFALGTAVGDLISEGLELGYGVALSLFSASIALVAIGFYILKLHAATLLFWIAFILTRPVGASLGDLLIQPTTEGGLGFGLTTINIIFLSTILYFITYLTITKKDTQLIPMYKGN